MTDDELYKNKIYNKLKDENTLETIKKEFNEFISKSNSSEKQFLVKIKNKANIIKP